MELEAARAEVAGQLAEAQSSIAELAAGKQALESSLAATKASMQACEDKLVSAEVSTCLATVLESFTLVGERQCWLASAGLSRLQLDGKLICA